MRPFDSKEEAYHAGVADGWADGWEASRNAEEDKLKEEIRKLEEEIQLCPALRYHTKED